jgi:hypothetical protein
MSFWDDLEQGASNLFGAGQPDAQTASDSTQPFNPQSGTVIGQGGQSTNLDKTNTPAFTMDPQAIDEGAGYKAQPPTNGSNQSDNTYMQDVMSGKTKLDTSNPAFIDWARDNIPNIPASASDDQISNQADQIIAKFPNVDPGKALIGLNVTAQNGLLAPAIQQIQQNTGSNAPAIPGPSTAINTGPTGLQSPNPQQLQPQSQVQSPPITPQQPTIQQPQQGSALPFHPNLLQAFGAGINTSPGGAAETLGRLQNTYNENLSAQKTGMDNANEAVMNDPTSPISSAARQQLLKFMPDLAKSPQFNTMSASQAIELSSKIGIPLNAAALSQFNAFKPTDKQTDDWNTMEQARTKLNRILQYSQQLQQQGTNTGVINTPVNTLLTKYNLGGNPTMSQLQQELDTSEMSTLHGALGRVSNFDVSKFGPDFMNASMTPQQIQSRAELALDDLNKQEGVWKSSLSGQHKNTAGLVPGADANQSNSSQQPSNSSGTVHMVTPDGKSWNVPNNPQAINAAQARGAKQVG